MLILVVEDEKKLADAICTLLCNAGYRSEAVHDGAEALDYAQAIPYDLIILDVMLPSLSGFEIVQQLRRKGIGTPILMLTARSSIPDKVAGLDAGADDYMTKPFHADELLARVKAMTRRKGEVIMSTLTFDDLSLNLDTGILSSTEHSVQLSKRELDVARIFLSNPGMIVTKQTLLLRVWGMNDQATENNVEVYISFLRKKMRFIQSRVTIGTQVMVGYKLEVRQYENI